MEKKYRLDLDIYGVELDEIMYFNSNNINTCVLEFCLLDHGIPLNLEGINVFIQIQLPNKEIIEVDSEKEYPTRGLCRVVLPKKAVAVSGTYQCKVCIAKDSKFLSFDEFLYHIRSKFEMESSGDDEGDKPSESIEEYTLSIAGVGRAGAIIAGRTR